MQENSFEKQVRERLDDLQFQPTAPVWRNVAVSIRRRRRRRIAAYLSIAVLLGMAGWLLLSPHSGNKHENRLATEQPTEKASQQQAQSNSSSNSSDKEPKVLENADNPTQNENTGIAVTNGELKDRDSGIAANDNKGSSDSNGQLAASSKSRQTPSRNRNAAVRSTSDPYDQNSAAVSMNTNLAGSQELLTNAIAKLQHSLTEAVIDADGLRHPEIDSALASNEMKPTTEKPYIATATAQQVAKRKIQWAAELSAGMGRRQNEIFPGIGTLHETVDLFQGSAVTAPPASFGVMRVLPSESKYGPAFGIGVSARIPLTQKINLLAGLRYQYQSEKIKVGIRRDTSIRFLNAASNLVDARAVYNGPAYYDHTNRYHFVQAPIAVEFQLNRGRKTPIFFELGAAPGYLIASNAVVYDSAFSGIYYKDKSLLTRFNVAGNTALSIQFGNKGPVKFAIGPEFRVNATPLSESKYDSRQYLMYAGIRTRVFF